MSSTQVTALLGIVGILIGLITGYIIGKDGKR